MCLVKILREVGSVTPSMSMLVWWSRFRVIPSTVQRWEVTSDLNCFYKTETGEGWRHQVQDNLQDLLLAWQREDGRWNAIFFKNPDLLIMKFILIKNRSTFIRRKTIFVISLKWETSLCPNPMVCLHDKAIHYNFIRN